MWSTVCSSAGESFIPTLEPYIVEGVYEKMYYIGPVDNLCSFKTYIEHLYAYHEYTGFRRPRRLAFIISDKATLFEEIAAVPLNAVYSTVCAVSIGNLSIDGNLMTKLSVTENGQPCLFSVDSLHSLANIASNISIIINNGPCQCGNETLPSSRCKAEGEPCTRDGDCDQPSQLCKKGICTRVICLQPDVFDPQPTYDYGEYSYFYYRLPSPTTDFGFYEDYDYHTLYNPYGARVSGGAMKMKKDWRVDAADDESTTESKPMQSGNRGVDQRNTKNQMAFKPRLRLLTNSGYECCTWDEFQCSGVPAVCLNFIAICDGINDCFLGDDETPEACAKRLCDDRWFKCNSGQCIEQKLRCNGIKNCPDGSDEYCVSYFDCPLMRPHFCSSGKCIGYRKICDRVHDCKSGEDEIHCRCKSHRCSPVKCLMKARVCDGVIDCADKSDEYCSEEMASCPKDRPFKCDIGKCLHLYEVCNGQKDCIDGSDEATALCLPESCFYCNSGKCILNTTVCDGFYDCDDISDEIDCKNFVCEKSQYHCNSGECLEESVKCNGREECADGSDELICDSCPDSRPLRCSSGECISYTRVCNGIYDCDDRSDESKCMNLTCPADRTTKCVSGQCYCPPYTCYSKYLYTYYTYCVDYGAELTNPAKECKEFKCKSGTCMTRCDGHRSCDDGGDEEDCEGVPCPFWNGWRCKSQECILNNLRCDGYKDCYDGSDEDCEGFICSSPEYEFQCTSGQCISSDRKCNGISDCKDGSDETDCTALKCETWQEQCKAGQCLLPTLFCNGRPDCIDGSDEISCQDYKCPAHRSFKCQSGICRKASQRCDGFISCQDGSDEKDCQNYSCPTYRPYSCPSGICITFYQLCNGVDDCGDGSDERDCTKIKCPSKTFRCNKGNCLPKRYRCDGEKDCDDGEDELNC